MALSEPPDGAPLAELTAAVCVRDGVPVLRGVHL